MNASVESPFGIGSLPGGADGPDSSKRPVDNLSVMLFVAALFHAIVILGVSFTGPTPDEDAAEVESMEVVLLTRDYEKRPDSDEAAYLAQQNLVGSGTTEADAALRVSYGRDSNPVMPGPEQDGVAESDNSVARSDASNRILYAQTPAGGTLPESRTQQSETSAPMRTGMPGTANSIEILATPDMESVLKGLKPRELLISANTRESRIASYLDGWKRRVERVGTINFPFELLDRPGTVDPVLAVSIAANGELTEVIVLRSSNNTELDRAAVNILTLAAPFDPFPEFLRSDYDALKFSYEWQFTGNRVGRMTVP